MARFGLRKDLKERGAERYANLCNIEGGYVLVGRYKDPTSAFVDITLEVVLMRHLKKGEWRKCTA